MEGIDQLLDVFVKQGVMRDRVHPLAVLGRIGQLAMYQEIGDLEEATALGQLLDGIAAVAENAPLAVDEGDRAPAARGVEKGGIVAQQSGARPIRGDLLEIGGGDRAIPDGDLVAAAGSVVGDSKRLVCHSYRTLSASRSPRHGPAIASFHSRMDHPRTTPLRTKGSLLAKASAASRVVKIPIDPCSWALANVPIISSVPSPWNSFQRATCAAQRTGALER